MEQSQLEKAEDIGLLKAFKLTNSLNVGNIVCFNQHGKLQKYGSPIEILKEFYELRLTYYSKRKEHMVYVLQDDYERLHNKANFIEFVLNDQLKYYKRKEKDIIVDMEKLGLKKMYSRQKKSVLAVDDHDDDDDEGDKKKDKTNKKEQKNEDSGYDYLFTVNIRGFTEEKIAELRRQRDNKKSELDQVKATAPTDFWKKDLDKFLIEWDLILKEDEEMARLAKPLATSKQATKRKRVTKPKKEKD